jgi:hypothetical protein
MAIPIHDLDTGISRNGRPGGHFKNLEAFSFSTGAAMTF